MHADNRRLLGIAAGIVILIAWTGAASEWNDKGCGMMQGYGYVISHGGGPDRNEGCEEYFGDVSYTDDYQG